MANHGPFEIECVDCGEYGMAPVRNDGLMELPKGWEWRRLNATFVSKPPEVHSCVFCARCAGASDANLR